MSQIPTESVGRERWLRGFLAVGRTFALILGSGGLGLLVGMCYGAWLASQGKPGEEFITLLALIFCLIVYGAIGFVLGLAVGILGFVVVGIVQLVRGRTGGRPGPPEGDLRPDDPLAGVVDVREPGPGGEGRRED